MSAKGTSGSNTSTKPDEAVLRHISDRIKTIRQEFEELLFLKYCSRNAEGLQEAAGPRKMGLGRMMF